MSEQLQQQQLSIVDLAPARWFGSRAASSVWVTGFQAAAIPETSAVAANVDLGDAIILICSGQLSYFDGGTLSIEVGTSGGAKVEAKVGGLKTTPPGIWLVAATPFEVDGQPGSEIAATERVSAAAGLCAVFCGRNAIAKRQFDNVAKADGSSTSGFSTVALNPAVFPNPDFQPHRLQLLARAGAAVSSFSESVRNRVRLSLHWYESALRSEGIDSFLKSWIALEVLAMPNTTNIRPINEALAAAYGTSVNAAAQRFGVGRLFGLRGRIVHGGELVARHYLLEAYAQAVYSDVLCQRLGIPTQRDAETLLESRGDLTRLLHV